MKKVEVTIVGAGVIGLAIAAELSTKHQVLVLERHDSFGQETSSRNSEVIHAGIYYQPGSLKAQLCVEGNHHLYQLCSDHGIPHRKTGKLIIASDETELAELEKTIANGRSNGATLELLSATQVRKMEPNVSSVGAIYSPNTGIINSHLLMTHFRDKLLRHDGMIAFRCAVTGIEKKAEGFKVMVNDQEGDFAFDSQFLINAAGLQSDQLAAMTGIDIEQSKYRLHYCKGEYFSLSKTYTTRLVYPVPNPREGGLGVHITLDLQGRTRLGPNAIYVDDIEYTVDVKHLNDFHASASKLLPTIQPEGLSPDFAGVRPKLQGPGEPFRDFVIRHESDKGLPGLINLVGIESPGLTASPSIAKYVAKILEAIS